MRDIHNTSLFTEITPEEEVTVQGGDFWDALRSGTKAFYNWVNSSNTGIILGDSKGTSSDWGRIGSPGQDLPYGWTWGVIDRGRPILGGYNNKWNWIVDQIRKVAKI